MMGGWSALPDSPEIQGVLESHPEIWDLSFAYFVEHVLPTLGAQDAVFVLSSNSEGVAPPETLKEALIALRSQGVPISVLNVQTGSKRGDVLGVEGCTQVDVLLPPTSSAIVSSFCVEFSSKLVLNAISTSAHITNGKVLENIMIDLAVSNNKLFHRSLRIIQQFADVDEESARTALLRAIYDTDSLSKEATAAATPVSEHIRAAQRQQRGVVPRAILLAGGGVTVELARTLLSADPLVSNALKAVRVAVVT